MLQVSVHRDTSGHPQCGTSPTTRRLHPSWCYISCIMITQWHRSYHDHRRVHVWDSEQSDGVRLLLPLCLPIALHSADILLPPRPQTPARCCFLRSHLLGIYAEKPHYTAAAAREHRRVIAPGQVSRPRCTRRIFRKPTTALTQA